MNKFTKKIGLSLLILTLLSPLGIILPKWFNAEGGWGEWSTRKVKKELGYVPKGMKKDADLWKAPMPDYRIGKENTSLFKGSLFYILSGFVGIGFISLVTWWLFKNYQQNE